jgi:NhaP-type Na+/H+ or K+/H+ antiporter
MTTAVLEFNAQLERIAEMALVLVTGAVLAGQRFSWQAMMLAFALFCVIRPLVAAPLARAQRLTRLQTGLVSWFGVRGIGSVYYLFYALSHGVPERLATALITLTLWTIACSIVVHGITATPLMSYYERRHSNRRSTRG